MSSATALMTRLSRKALAREFAISSTLPSPPHDQQVYEYDAASSTSPSAAYSDCIRFALEVGGTQALSQRVCGRRMHHDGGFLHPDAFGHDVAAGFGEPDGDRRPERSTRSAHLARRHPLRDAAGREASQARSQGRLAHSWEGSWHPVSPRQRPPRL